MNWVMCHRMWITLFGVVTFFLSNAEGAIAGWKKTPTQYHIQTDEGSERYFRYQTYNGQYRKERRLDDGTVIGSYGWVDPAGFLRMTDYIADSKGYRVVKELMEFVGTNSILENPPDQPKYSPSMKHSTRVLKPPGNGIFKTFPSTTIQSTTVYEPPIIVTTPSPPILETQPPPVLIVYGPSRKRINNNPNAATAYNNYYDPSSKVPSSSYPYTSRFGNRRPSIQELKNSEVQESSSSGKKDVFQNYATPLNKDKSGFIYKIPHQYHKEETERGTGDRNGAFGYIDPFGIRRVIHYNASNNGFQATKDFKFVGRQY